MKRNNSRGLLLGILMTLGLLGLAYGLAMFTLHINDFVIEIIPTTRTESGSWPLYIEPQVKTEKPTGEQSSQAQAKPRCGFDSFSAPQNAKIYMTGAYAGNKTGGTLGPSNHKATTIEVVVNSPDPVILLLGAYEPNIWQIKWTEKSTIAAVVVSGYHTQKIVGLVDDVPVINSSYENKGPCGFFYYSDQSKKSPKASQLSQLLFGRDFDSAVEVVNGQAIIGEPISQDAPLLTSEDY